MPPRLKCHALSEIEVQPSAAPPLPPVVAAFLSDAGARIDAFFDLWTKARNLGFFPSDYEPVYAVLKALRESNPEATRLCEWGSGFGVVAGLGALLGYEACGIEIDRRCVTASRSLLKDHGLDVTILEGSFVPEEFAEKQEPNADGTGTVLCGPGAIDEVDVEIDNFDLIFAFPWPDEQEMYYDLFARYAAVGAILVTYSALEGIRVQRKVKG
jgi:predicted O-methyltransferase YrrM